MKSYSLRAFLKLLREQGFEFVRYGKHEFWRHPDGRVITLPRKSLQPISGPVIKRALTPRWQSRKEPNTLMTRVVIVETNVLGQLAYHARCLECNWTSRRFETEARAVAVAKEHRCEAKAGKEPK